VVELPDPADLPDPVLPPDPLGGLWLDLLPDEAPEFVVPVDLVAWDAEHEGAFALSLGSLRPSRMWVGGVPAYADVGGTT